MTAGYYGGEARPLYVTLGQAEDGWIVTECPVLSVCVSQSKDGKEAVENIKEPIVAWLWPDAQKATVALPKERGRKPIVAAV